MRIEHAGETLTVAQWAERTGILATTIYYRIVNGWPPARALTARPRPQCRRGGRPRADAPRPVPGLKRHPSGRAYCRWKAGGRTRERSFGPWGSDAARAAYARFAAEWLSGAVAAPPGAAAPTTVGGLAAAWVRWAAG